MAVDQSTDAPLMNSAEIWFLRAEAALRGWTPEDEEECYLNGIKASLHQHGIYQMDDYLNSERTADLLIRMMLKTTFLPVAGFLLNGIRQMIKK